ncbi:MAG: LysE family transporter [Desulfovibrio sp.]|uniref:LysE family translocator n=1 Tax=Desulfovibrio sp. TaxID=885 RepID=UPI001A73D681|nr:LysE family transporter [Desulfovibrio sp.]MBD5418121.1 LysE family transporter [Desulfovibrio sp.]
MLPLENLLLFVPAMALLVMLPGPDFALVSRVALLEGAGPARAAACGVALGITVHTGFAIAGISAIIAASAPLFQLLKYAGAAYLFWLGVQSFRQKAQPIEARGEQEAEVARGQQAPLRRAFRQGFLTNALNPKAILYFLTLLPQFISPVAPAEPQLLEMGAITALECLVWYLFLAQILVRVRRVFAVPRFQRWLHRVTGAIFLGFGLRLALAGND